MAEKGDALQTHHGLGLSLTTMPGGSAGAGVIAKHRETSVGPVRDELYKTRLGTRTYGTQRYAVTKSGAAAQERAKQEPLKLAAAGIPVSGKWVEELQHDGIHIGGPLVVQRSVKHGAKSQGCAYKAASICAGYFVTQGLILASGADMHRDLVPIPAKVRADLRSKTSDTKALNATHFLMWCTAVPLDSTSLDNEIAMCNRAGAWVVPPGNKPPPIDLETHYSSQWVTVLSNLLRGRNSLPTIVPPCGWHERAGKRRKDSETVINDAFEACREPQYSDSELRLVAKAWNIIAMRSRSLSRIPDSVFTDAAELLSYLVSADEFSKSIS